MVKKKKSNEAQKEKKKMIQSDPQVGKTSLEEKKAEGENFNYYSECLWVYKQFIYHSLQTYYPVVCGLTTLALVLLCNKGLLLIFQLCSFSVLHPNKVLFSR